MVPSRCVSKKENEMKNLFKWVFLIGLLAAVIAGLAHFAAGWFTSLLILLAILAGIFYFDSADVVHLGIRFVALTVSAVSLNKLIGIGSYLTDIFVAAVNYIGPAVLTVLVVYFVKKYFFRQEVTGR
jgi:hypothetical protein